MKCKLLRVSLSEKSTVPCPEPRTNHSSTSQHTHYFHTNVLRLLTFEQWGWDVFFFNLYFLIIAGTCCAMRSVKRCAVRPTYSFPQEHWNWYITLLRNRVGTVTFRWNLINDLVEQMTRTSAAGKHSLILFLIWFSNRVEFLPIHGSFI